MKCCEVKSPCVKKCSLDKDKVCPACNRTLDEIVAWPEADDHLRNRILEAARLRRAGRT
ncbi:MAG: DUF1289 domain-containing protein [Thermodesulfovibrio sp.]|nr:DUF1289 domain-containing protein [Thermodesulfovibrio sp.]